MKSLLLFVLFILFVAYIDESVHSDEQYPNHIDDIRIRDPFIYPDSETKTYYMYAQTGNRMNGFGSGVGVEVYTSKDLNHWSEPKLVFKRPAEFWGGKEIWAPEMHKIDEYFYLFVTFNGREGGRGTQILRAEKPDGPFTIFSDKACTPYKQCSLDGTPYIDETGQRWMVYCHEWIQIDDGAMIAVKMKDDFSERISNSYRLFRASEAPWVRSLKNKPNSYVTDGPCFYKTKDGTLLMLWSSFTGDGSTYAIGIAESKSGEVLGPWEHHPEPLFNKNGGHCMLFKTFNGQLMLALHQPNSGGKERAKLFMVEEKDGRLIINK
jgi:arabinan endo-1,5-alpha-L-arabinosidase